MERTKDLLGRQAELALAYLRNELAQDAPGTEFKNSLIRGAVEGVDTPSRRSAVLTRLWYAGSIEPVKRGVWRLVPPPALPDRCGGSGCEDCGTTEGVTCGPCPYASDVEGDDTPHLLCVGCSDTRAQDI